MSDFEINWKDVKINAVQLFNIDNYFHIGMTPVYQRKIASFTWVKGGIVAVDENNKPIMFINDDAISYIYYE